MTAAPSSRRTLRRDADALVLALAGEPAMTAAISELNRGRLSEAERIVRAHLARSPGDAAALCLLGDLAARAGVHAEAERLFRLALASAPLFAEAQFNLARLLALRDGVAEAIALLDELLPDFPERTDMALMRLALLGQIGDYALAADGYAELLKRCPNQPAVLVAAGHLRNTIGDGAGSIAAYRQAIVLQKDCAEAWWGLANLKTYRFTGDEMAMLRRVAGEPASGTSQQAGLLHFALGKALADAREDEAAFAHYARGNAICHTVARHDARATSAEVDRSITFFTPKRMAEMDGLGHPSTEPTFILGMPRSGSTLVEQILASHPAIEGTSELPYIPMLVHRLLAERWSDNSLRFPDMLAGVPTERLHALGQDYLDAAAVHRHAGRAMFIDKLPNNWRYVGFIRMILPNARIIDTRREAMACLWSNYRQWFARGQEWSYAFDDLARTWHDYRRLMAHFDEVMPGAVIPFAHEALLTNPEREIRSLLDRIGLPFDESCLRFHENDRPVRTASARQVRQPINRHGDAEWLRFRAHLSRLEELVASFALKTEHPASRIV